MESVRLAEDRPYQYDALSLRARSSQHRSPRLPTPEYSRSSYEAFDSDEQQDSQAISQAPFSEPQGASSRWHEREGRALRRDSTQLPSHNQGHPVSPPYRTSDLQRPLLPPINTILGDTIRNSSYTPISSATPRQPSPREPNIVVDPYKPPSLYGNNPNKKQKVEQARGSITPLTTPNEFPTRRHHSTSFNTNVDNLNPSASKDFATLPALTNVIQQNHQTTKYTTLQGTHPASSPNNRMSRHSFSPRQFETVGNTNAGNSAPVYRTPEGTPINNIPDFEWEGRYTTHNSAHGSQERHYLDRGPQTRERVKRIPFHPGQEEREVILRLKPTSPRSSNIQSDITRGICQTKPPSGFFPSPYEYQHIKVRKRSNLPKQSTEIMKVWFDQNLANPYPSEEQKAIFSNATGISMTQVSNWFINHRRRCPELRDKREKSRVQEYEL